MPKIITDEAKVKTALKKLFVAVREEGAILIYHQASISSLMNAINVEYARGADGSVYDVLVDLNNSVGLGEFNIFIEY